MSKKIKVYWLREKIAYRLDENPEYCWASLTMWMLGYRRFWSLFFKSHSENDYKQQICRKGNKETPYGYCGKCEQNGRFNLTPNQE